MSKSTNMLSYHQPIKPQKHPYKTIESQQIFAVMATGPN